MTTLEIVCLVLGIACAIAIFVNVYIFVIRKKKKADKKAEQKVEQKFAEIAAESTVADAALKEPDETEADLRAEQVAKAFSSGRVRESEHGAVVHTSGGDYIYLSYNKSFKAKLIQGKEDARRYYSELKNFISAYKKVNCRISWKQESVNSGRNKICRLVLRGKSLYLYLPLNPDDYADTKYKVERAEAKRFEELPCLYKIKNDRRAKYATELIATVFERCGVERGEWNEIDFTAEYPYEETLPLIRRGLIRVMRSNRNVVPDDEMASLIEANKVRIEPREEVRVQEANELMTDEQANSMVITGTRRADTTKKGIVNIDVLSRCFEDGEKVTLEEIKKRVAGFDKKVTFVKVLARGVLDKNLIVEADEFSVEAQKMILLMGGQVIKTMAN